MQLFAPNDPRPIHFMGIAGAGMSALALMARRRGVAVTGCDTDPAGAADVALTGAEVRAGHDPAHVAGARAVVHTAAIPPDHAELRAARDAGIPVVRRAVALHQAIEGGRVVAVGGTHGKTTTTVMSTEAYAAAGGNPTGLVGGRVGAWEGNARYGDDRVFVVEADEYDRAFLELRPDIGVITNVEADHLDCYGSMAALEAAFVTFAGRSGRLVVGADDAGAQRVADAVGGAVWQVGFADSADVRLSGLETGVQETRAAATFPDGQTVAICLTVPGVHNMRNAGVALAVVALLGGDLNRAAAALTHFHGVARRFDLVGEARGIVVVDDYAHHPTEVAATLAAARQRFPDSRVIAVFQPHLYSRTAVHGAALGSALAAADAVVVTDVYAAREEPVEGITGRLVFEAAQNAGATCTWVPRRSDVAARLEDLAQSGDVVLTLGAGDITGVGPELLRRLRGQAA